jgi:hypothetical protein
VSSLKSLSRTSALLWISLRRPTPEYANGRDQRRTGGETKSVKREAAPAAGPRPPTHLFADRRHLFVPCTERLCKLVPSLTKHSETSCYILLLADKIFQVRKERKVQRLPKTHLVIPHLDSRWLKAVSQK